jgi:hypothetical protein
MNDLDRKIRDALAAADAELPGLAEEPSLPEEVVETFRGRHRWLVVLVFVFSTAFTIFAVVAAVQFFRAESVREMIAWAAGFGMSLIAIAMYKIWYWMELSRNALKREIKRVELQLAYLASKSKKSE